MCQSVASACRASSRHSANFPSVGPSAPTGSPSARRGSSTRRCGATPSAVYSADVTGPVTVSTEISGGQKSRIRGACIRSIPTPRLT